VDTMYKFPGNRYVVLLFLNENRQFSTWHGSCYYSCGGGQWEKNDVYSSDYPVSCGR
jgi:hypothetical protein